MSNIRDRKCPECGEIAHMTSSSPGTGTSYFCSACMNRFEIKQKRLGEF